MKRLNLVVVLLLLQLVVAACGDGSPAPTTPPAPPIPVPPPPPTNRAPTVGTAIGDQSVEEGAQVTVSVSGAFSDPDGNTLSYAATSDAPTVATATVAGTDVTVTGVAPGTATVTVTATDPGGLSASQTFGVTVTSANQPPAVGTAIGDQSLAAGAEMTIDLSGAFTDPDGDTLSYVASSDASDVATASVSGSELTTTGVAPGTATVTVTATDPEGLSASQTFSVTVTDGADDTNQAPTVGTAIEDQTLEAEAEATLDLSEAFSDPDGDTLSYDAASDAPDVATASVSGSELTVTGVAPGTATVTVTATDPEGLSASQTFSVTVSDGTDDTNQAPTVGTAIGDQTLQVGVEAIVDLSGAFSDPEGDTLSYDAASDAPAVATASVSGSELTLTGVAPGPATVTVTATDPGGLSATQTFGVTVEAAATEPTLDALFAPATAAEIEQVEAEWATRTPEVSGVRLELDSLGTNILTGPLRYRVFSHTVGGVRHYGAVVTPEGAETGSLPVIVVAHGDTLGADVDRTALLNFFLPDELTSALVIPSYRAEALRFPDRRYVSEGPPSPWDQDVDDVLSFLSVAFQEAPELDEERVVALGFSRGGTVALIAAARDKRIDAVVELAGPTDFLGEYAREIVEEALEGEVRSLPGFEDLHEMVIQPWEEGTLSTAEARIELVRRSPVYFVDHMPPVQLHHGDADQVVAWSEAQRLSDVMREAGKPDEESEVFIHPGLDDNQTTLLTTAQPDAIEFARPFLSNP